MRTQTLCLVLAACIVLCSCIGQPQYTRAIELDEMQILVIVANGFGWNYFGIVENFTAWGANVTTLGYALQHEVESCYNRPQRPITADYLVSEFDLDMLSQFDCVIVPAGGHWNGLYDAGPVNDIICQAYEDGLIISGICIGNTVVSNSFVENNVSLADTKVASYTHSNPFWRAVDATPVLGRRIVTDGNVITGGTGGGFPDGFQTAPTYETCVAIARKLLGLSYIESTAVDPTSSEGETEFTISTDIAHPTEWAPGLNYSDVESIDALVYYENGTLLEEIDLLDTDSDFTFSETFTVNEIGNYYVTIEVSTDEYGFEIARSTATFSVLGSGLSDLTLIVGSIAVLGIVAVIFVLVWRRRA